MKINQDQPATIPSYEPLILMSATCLSTGTDGDDVLVSQADGQTLFAFSGDDTLVGLADASHLDGGDGEDLLFLVGDHTTADGGSGHDVAVLWQTALTDARVERVSADLVRVFTGDSTHELRGIEVLRFSDDILSAQDIAVTAPAYRSFDGTGNNVERPELGSTDERLLRLSDPEYGDGVDSPAGADRPSARLISNQLSSQNQPTPNGRGLSDAVWLWGQFLDHDISLSTAADPHELFPIPVPADDPLFDPFGTGEVEIELNRTVYDPESGLTSDVPRAQVNQITAWIDGGMVYGSDDTRAAALRSFEGGQLLVTDDDLLIFNDRELPNAADGVPPGTQLFLAGDVRANENIALAAMHTLWVREHNRIAEEIACANPTLTDEDIYQQSRERVIAQIQAITYNDFLPALLGENVLPVYDGYDADVDPTIANEFSTAAYRFGHSMLSEQLLRLNNDRTAIEAGHIELRDAFFSPQEIVDEGIDSVLLGVTAQVANEVDTLVVDDIRNFLFGPPGAGGFDLVSLNIQRGRDHGLADYNQVRQDLGLGAVSHFDEISSDPVVQYRLQELYGSVDNIDLWVGGLAEDHAAGSSMGETFRAIIADQFARLRDADRFWYQRILSASEVAQVESTTLADVIARNTTVTDLQADVFFATSAV